MTSDSDSMGAAPAPAGLLTLDEVARRLRRGRRHVEYLLASRVLGYIDGKPPLVREAELWRYLILQRFILPEAFGSLPLSMQAEEALNTARSAVLADHLANQIFEVERLERLSLQARARAREKASRPRLTKKRPR